MLNALLKAAGYVVTGVSDPRFSENDLIWDGVKVLGDDSALTTFKPSEYLLVNGIGQLPRSTTRRDIQSKGKAWGFDFPSLVHPASWVAPGVRLEGGVQVMAGGILQPGSSIGEATIINTKASVDHDSRIGAHVHIAPGATICGGVSIGDEVFVGAGAVILPGINVARRAVIGAGAVVRKDIQEGGLVVGAEELGVDENWIENK